MRSKTSKSRARPPGQPRSRLRSRKKTTLAWREEPSCSESRLESLAGELARELASGHRVLLEGPMGAGKTTFARALIQGLGVRQPPEGSPSFAIAHEYRSERGDVVHLDLFRVHSPQELEETGIPSYFWERKLIAITEWTSLFPQFEKLIRESGPSWTVHLDFAADPDRRSVKITSP